MNYAEELATASHAIERLKRRYARRRAQMAQLLRREPADLPTFEAPEPERKIPRLDIASTPDPKMTIKHLLACCLLAPGTFIPVDTIGLHSKAKTNRMNSR